MEERRLAFVLSGGGARGAFQAGALKALFENNIHPEFLVGTSIGAINAAFLAVHGINSSSIERLIQTWIESVRMDLLPKHFAWLTLRTNLNTPDYRNFKKMQNFFEAHGVGPDLSFRDMREIQLYLMAWLEDNLAEGFTVFDFPLEHRRSVRTTNSLERINKEIRRRTRVVGVQTRALTDPEQAYIGLHARAFTPSTRIENIPEAMSGYTDSTLLTMLQVAAYTAPGMFERGSALTTQEETPAFAFYPDIPGNITLARQWSSETGLLTDTFLKLVVSHPEMDG